MRSFIIIGILILLAAGAEAQDSLRIISPNGGEKFLTGSDTVITWTGIPLTDTVKLEYSNDAGSSWNFITDTATGGHYPWHVPKTVSDSCLVRVEKNIGQPIVSKDSIIDLPGNHGFVFYSIYDISFKNIYSSTNDSMLVQWDIASERSQINT